MSKSMYCPNCGAYVGDCGHVSGGLAGPSTLSGTCGKCEQKYSVTCNGDCLKEKVQTEQETFIINLQFSEDGKMILDDNGNELARFRDDLVVHSADKDVLSRLPGHLECKNECIAWDSNEKCVKTYQSCTWVFDPLKK